MNLAGRHVGAVSWGTGPSGSGAGFAVRIDSHGQNPSCRADPVTPSMAS